MYLPDVRDAAFEGPGVDLAGISLAALVVTVLVSCTTRVNPSLLALVFAWLIGVYLAPLWGQSIGMKGVVAGFPADMFLTLTAVTATQLWHHLYISGDLCELPTRVPSSTLNG